MSICSSWSVEHGCDLCRDRWKCSDLGLTPFEDASNEEISALADEGVLPERANAQANAPARTGD